jgi:hypothetical protein
MSNRALMPNVIKLPSRFQIGQNVRVGRRRGSISSVIFGEGTVDYEVFDGRTSLGVFPSYEVSEPLKIVEVA